LLGSKRVKDISTIEGNRRIKNKRAFKKTRGASAGITGRAFGLNVDESRRRAVWWLPVPPLTTVARSPLSGRRDESAIDRPPGRHGVLKITRRKAGLSC